MKFKQVTTLIQIILVATLFSSVALNADDSTLSHETRLNDLEKRVATLEAIIGKLPLNPGKFITSKGALFTEVGTDRFGKSWKDPSGMVWSNYVTESSWYEATSKCKDLGGWLPSYEDYERLISYFDKNEKGILTEKGSSELTALFRDMKMSFYWTSSTWQGGAYLFRIRGERSYDIREAHGYSVRCVSR